jgi:hypothetical protein
LGLKNLTPTQYPSCFLPIEKIGEDLGCQISKRLVKIGQKDWKKDWQKIGCFFFHNTSPVFSPSSMEGREG